MLYYYLLYHFIDSIYSRVYLNVCYVEHTREKEEKYQKQLVYSNQSVVWVSRSLIKLIIVNI